MDGVVVYGRYMWYMWLYMCIKIINFGILTINNFYVEIEYLDRSTKWPLDAMVKGLGYSAPTICPPWCGSVRTPSGSLIRFLEMGSK